MSKNEAKIDPQIVEAEENFLIDFQFQVQDLIDAKKISRSELAKKAGITKGRLSQILSAEANPTVKTFARLFQALGVKVAPQVISEVRQTVSPAHAHTAANEWQVDKTLESAVAEFRRGKSKARDRLLMKEWRGATDDGASNDNVAEMFNVKKLRLMVA